jgi:hypothetical protein
MDVPIDMLGPNPQIAGLGPVDFFTPALPKKLGMNPGARKGLVVPSFYKTPTIK